MQLQDYIDLYHRNITDGSFESRSALKYLNMERGITMETINRFQIGVCHRGDPIPESPNKKFDKNGRIINENWILKGKVIVPIYSEFSEPIALSCRGIGRGGTWWNTSFDKNNHIFLLGEAKRAIFASDKAYIGEGQIDGIVAHQAGIGNFVTLMSTILGIRRISHLSRYCSKICIVFDTDENCAGQNARNKAIHELFTWKRDFSEISNVSIIELPQGVDPDEYILEHGAQKFLELERALPDPEIEAISKGYLQSRRNKNNGSNPAT